MPEEHDIACNCQDCQHQHQQAAYAFFKARRQSYSDAFKEATGKPLGKPQVYADYCGSPAGYRLHYALAEDVKACQPCRQAMNAYNRHRRQASKARQLAGACL